MQNKSPLFIVTGASGTGKTTIVAPLRKLMPDFDVFDIDVISQDVDDWQKLKNIWLRVASNIAKSGRITILCGTIMSWDAEKCDDYDSFSQIYYLNLHCDDATREKRLREREWSEEMIKEHKHFAKWLLENADEAFTPKLPTFNTTCVPPNKIAVELKEWILSNIN